MYTPAGFARTDIAALHEFIEQHSFGLLVTSRGCGDEAAPEASHLPFLLDRDQGRNGRLIGHFARANGQWRDANGRRALTVFSGPHAYISPTWYGVQNSVPTWNYVAVHATGTLRLIEDRDRLIKLLHQTVNVFEASRQPAWSLETPEPEFVERLLEAIVGFEIEIELLEGKWKLSQNHDADRREAVVHGLQATGRAGDLEIAELMSTNA